MDQLLEKKYHDKGAQALFDSKRANYKADVENYNKEETDSAQHLTEFDTYDAIHGQADIVDISVNEKRNAIRDDEIAIEKIDREIKENQVNEKVIDNEVKDKTTLDYFLENYMNLENQFKRR